MVTKWGYAACPTSIRYFMQVRPIVRMSRTSLSCADLRRDNNRPSTQHSTSKSHISFTSSFAPPSFRTPCRKTHNNPMLHCQSQQPWQPALVVNMPIEHNTMKSRTQKKYLGLPSAEPKVAQIILSTTRPTVTLRSPRWRHLNRYENHPHVECPRGLI